MTLVLHSLSVSHPHDSMDAALNPWVDSAVAEGASNHRCA